MTANFVLLILRTQATPPYAILYKVLRMPIESRGLLTCARDTRIVAAVESGDYFFHRVWRCGFYSRAATNPRAASDRANTVYEIPPCELMNLW